MRNAIIIDIDNCLIDSSSFPSEEECKTDSREFWDDFIGFYSSNESLYNAGLFDLVLLGAGRLNTKVFFLTSREARTTDKHCAVDLTHQLVKKIACKYGLAEDSWELLMRPALDYSPSYECKARIYKSVIYGRYNVVCAIDDCVKNLSAFAEFNIPTALYSMNKKSKAGKVTHDTVLLDGCVLPPTRPFPAPRKPALEDLLYE